MSLKAIIFFQCILITVSCYPQSKDITIYVSPSGSDKATGALQNPLYSLAYAIQEAKNRIDNNTKINSIRILLRGGVYSFTNSVELSEGKTWNSKVPLTIEGFQNEKVIFHGGKIIPLNAVTKPGPENLQRFQPQVKDKIREIDLQAAGINDPGKLFPVGFGRPDHPSWTEVFFNGNPGIISRWPNDGTILIDSVINPGTDNSKSGGVFTYSHTRPSLWKDVDKIWIEGYFMHGWATDAVPLQQIDTIKQIITTALPTHYGFGTGKPWQSWYAYNIPEETDTAGEYFIDEEKNKIFFLPPDDLEKLEVSVLQTPFLVIGGVANVTIKNIEFTCSRGMGVYLEHSNGVYIQHCTFSNLGMMAAYLKEGSFNKNCGIVDCKIFNTGAGGVVLSGGNRETLEAGNNFISNCIIHDFNRIQKSYRPAVLITEVGNRIANCDIYNAPSMAILLHGNNHTIEYNNIHDVALQVDDQGAFYAGRDPSERGNKIKYNYFHNTGSSYNTNGIYIDDGECGINVFGNLFYKTGKRAVFIGGGSDNICVNNIFIETPYAVHVDNRLSNWAKNWVGKDSLFEKKLESVRYDLPPYSAQYPELKNYLKDDPAIPKRNVFSKNILINIKQSVDGNKEWLSYEKNNVETNDPDIEKLIEADFHLVGKETMKKPEGFKNIPFEKIGYQKLN